MFCFKRLSYIWLIILLLALVSCTKTPHSYLGISKIEVTRNLAYEKPVLDIYIFSTLEYHNLKIQQTEKMNSISSYQQNIKLKIQNQVLDGILHVFTINFKLEEFFCQEIVLLHKEQKIKVNFGMFQTLFLESSTDQISSNIEDNKMTVHNYLYQPLYFLEEKAVSIHQNHVISLEKKERIVVYSDSLLSYKVFDLKINDTYHQVSGVIQTKFKTNLTEYIIYTSYYIDDIPISNILKEGIDVRVLASINVK